MKEYLQAFEHTCAVMQSEPALERIAAVYHMRAQCHWLLEEPAMALAVLAGWLTGADGELFGLRVVSAYAFIGTLFLNALKMLIVPLIVSSIIVGVAGIGGSDNLGRLGGKTLLYYLATSTLATARMVGEICSRIPENIWRGMVTWVTSARKITATTTSAARIVRIIVRLIPPMNGSSNSSLTLAGVQMI